MSTDATVETSLENNETHVNSSPYQQQQQQQYQQEHQQQYKFKYRGYKYRNEPAHEQEGQIITHVQGKEEEEEEEEEQEPERGQEEEEEQEPSSIQTSTLSASTSTSISLSRKELECETWRNYISPKNILEGERRAYTEYHNLKKLSGTAIARVYRAYRGKRRVSLKMYLSTVIQSTAKFTNELTILRTIRHPNIIHLHDCWADNKYYYLEMEYCPGGDLWTYIEKYGSVNEHLARSVGYSLLDVLSTLHQLQYCHRDLKPENIVLVNKKNVSQIRVIDFGETIQVSKTQIYTNSTANLCYFAPELWKGMITGKELMKADVWSVGIIVLELLNGHRCFPSNSPTHVLRTAVAEFQPNISQTVSEECKQFIRSITTADPSKRPTAAKAWNHPWMFTTSFSETETKSIILKNTQTT